MVVVPHITSRRQSDHNENKGISDLYHIYSIYILFISLGGQTVLTDLYGQIFCPKAANKLLPKTMAASSTVRVKMPGTSMEFTRGISPCLDSRP